MGRIHEDVANMIDDIGIECVLELIEDEATLRADNLMEDFKMDGPSAKAWRKKAKHIRHCIDQIERDTDE